MFGEQGCHCATNAFFNPVKTCSFQNGYIYMDKTLASWKLWSFIELSLEVLIFFPRVKVTFRYLSF